jgi:hypothetical protein
MKPFRLSPVTPFKHWLRQQAEYGGSAGAVVAQHARRGLDEASGQVAAQARRYGNAHGGGGVPRIGRGHQREYVARAGERHRRIDSGIGKGDIGFWEAMDMAVSRQAPH